jgi:hypothetical protein
MLLRHGIRALALRSVRQITWPDHMTRVEGGAPARRSTLSYYSTLNEMTVFLKNVGT